MHYGLVRATKLTCKGIESNPRLRNYAIKKTIQASHYQCHVSYWRSAGMQCTSYVYLVIIFSIIKHINIWKSFDLDYILEQRNRVLKYVEVNQALAVDELLLNISIEGVHISTKMLVCENNLFAERNDLFVNCRNYTDSERGKQ